MSKLGCRNTLAYWFWARAHVRPLAQRIVREVPYGGKMGTERIGQRDYELPPKPKMKSYDLPFFRRRTPKESSLGSLLRVEDDAESPERKSSDQKDQLPAE